MLDGLKNGLQVEDKDTTIIVTGSKKNIVGIYSKVGRKGTIEFKNEDRKLFYVGLDKFIEGVNVNIS